MPFLITVVVVAGLTGSSVAVLSSIRRADAKPSWRARAQVGAWAVASISAFLFLGTSVYARVNGGVTYWDPTLMRIYRYGALTAMFGLATGLLGVGRVRASIVGLSGTMLLVWLVAASSE